MAFMDSFRRGAAEFINTMSPIKLFNTQQARKLGADLGHTAFPRIGNTSARWSAMSTHYPQTGDKIAAWWAGKSLNYDPARMDRAGSLVKSLYDKASSKRALYRRAAVGLLGTATVGTMVFGRDNIFSEMGTGAASATAVGLGAAGLAEWGAARGSPLGKVGAAGLVGWTALNMYRSGNNFGPF